MYEKAPENIEVSFPVKVRCDSRYREYADFITEFFNKVNDDRKIQVIMISI